MFDETQSRFDENTKFIIVEGNIGSGKSSLVKTLAEELDMRYYPEPSIGSLYVDDYGFDYRTIDHLLPESCRSCDMKRFYEDPHNWNVASMQITIYRMRYEVYLDAVAHVLNTGQGVIMERSAYSDIVFAETMHKFGYIRKPALDIYHMVRNTTLPELLRPHLVIYLDVPSEILLKRIKERNVPYEVNSKVLTKEYLDEIDRQYKLGYLRSIRDHSELLMFDWSNFGNPEVVVEDIERINFEKNMDDPHSPHFHDWKKKTQEDWDEYRYRVTAQKDVMMALFNFPTWDVPELIISGEDQEIYFRVLDEIKNNQLYMKGYNPHLGDSVLFKWYYNKWDAMETTRVFPP